MFLSLIKTTRSLFFLAVVVIFGFVTQTISAQTNFSLKYSPAPVDNPLKGLVPYQHPKPERFPHSMEFNYVSFGKLVTGPNEFDWTAIESLLNDVQSRGNQSIVRVYLEYPCLLYTSPSPRDS